MLPTPASLSQRLAISWPTDWSLCLRVCAGHRDEIVSELTGKKSSASTVRDAVGGCSDLLASSVPPSPGFFLPALLLQRHLYALEPPGQQGAPERRGAAFPRTASS